MFGIYTFLDWIIAFSAICDPPCQHHGVCVMPDTCACTSSWKGAKCDQGEKLNRLSS